MSSFILTGIVFLFALGNAIFFYSYEYGSDVSPPLVYSIVTVFLFISGLVLWMTIRSTPFRADARLHRDPGE